MGKISLLVGNTQQQNTVITHYADILRKSGNQISLYPFAGPDYPEQMEKLLSDDCDFIIASNLDVLSVTMTGGDYFINKFTKPVLILLDEPLSENIVLLTKRMNVTILFYSTNQDDIDAIRHLPHPLFCGFADSFENLEELLKRARKDLYVDL